MRSKDIRAWSGIPRGLEECEVKASLRWYHCKKPAWPVRLDLAGQVAEPKVTMQDDISTYSIVIRAWT
jgi:hypothetical protein